MSILRLTGPPALSTFRLEALRRRCRQLNPGLSDVGARYFYLVSWDGGGPGDRERLSALVGGAQNIELPNEPKSESPKRESRPESQIPESQTGLQSRGLPGAQSTPADTTRIAIAPRPGTISPWSSKATDILRNCGLHSVARIERGIEYYFDGTVDASAILPELYDRMTEAVLDNDDDVFTTVAPRPLRQVSLREGRIALERANEEMGLALSGDEVGYLFDAYSTLQRYPTDVELVMFANVNSEHCRHKIFNARWTIDGDDRESSLFAMIRNTHAVHPEGTVKAYADNAGVIVGWQIPVFRPASEGSFSYGYHDQLTHIVCKVETHNHPTAISPFPGAATGVGGEIRDEGATGIGGQSQAGLSAFFTSHLRLPGFEQPWEQDVAEFPSRLATPLEIMTDGPLGGAAFGNEFGRPNLLGVFRTYEELVAGRHRGYHKPIMVAGGVGVIAAGHVEKKQPRAGDCVIQLGGPAMLIGLGGGYASSMDTGSNAEDLDFASVQRDNPEMERRCQELISRCIAMDADNPIVSIHDVGAGGLSNACPELVEGCGARFDLRAIHNDDPGMSPMEIWCNEAQERYVLVVRREDLERFERLAQRERCLYAVIGEITGDDKLSVGDPLLGDQPVGDLPLEVILGKPPRMHRDVARVSHLPPAFDVAVVPTLDEAVDRVLRYPAVADKTFLITIADRTVTGLIARDQMVGPFQTPLSDVAVTAASFKSFRGSAMAMGERAPLALIDAPASGRMAIAEAITNIAAAAIGAIEKVKLSANWMCACGEEGEDAALFDTVEAVGMEFCPRLGVSIPVGKDSLSMRTVWEDDKGEAHAVVAPLSLVISAFAPVADIRATATPDLKDESDSELLLIDLGRGRHRLGGSCLAQVFNAVGDAPPDISPQDLRSLFAAVQQLLAEDLLLAYHDRSDGGLLATVAEMAFGGRRGVDMEVTTLGDDLLASLFAEEIGAVIQVLTADLERVRAVLQTHALSECVHGVGRPNDDGTIAIRHAGETAIGDGAAQPPPLAVRPVTAAEAARRGADRIVYRRPAADLRARWSELTLHMQALRDNPDCAREEHEFNADFSDPGPRYAIAGGDTEPAPDKNQSLRPSPAMGGRRPRVAVLREQGINGQVEMAAAFDAAGFEALDVTMTDLIDGRSDLAQFQALAACGGFSYGDVLGAGVGWARSILFNEPLRDSFQAFFERGDTVTLGVCNGCQMLAHLAELIPGSAGWPHFARNRSEQFEARLVTVEVMPSRSLLLAGMTGSRLPIAVAHGEGRAEFADAGRLASLSDNRQLCLRYIDNRGEVAMRYPFNPNGSPGGVTAVTNADGRVTLMMPHPERVFRNVQLSYRPDDWDVDDFSPWIELFRNAYRFATG